MALRLTPRLAPHLLPTLPAGLARYSSSCTPDPLAPLCPCPPKCPPPCRCRPSERLKARRVVCCPPPQGQKPPCTPKTAACSLTCANFASAHTLSTYREDIPPEPLPGKTPCDKHRDLVAQRLAAAKAERQRQYALDAARVEPPQQTPQPTLVLSGMRDCENATDGKTYLLKHDPGNTTAPLPCGPCRTPPPDTCVELVPDNACIPQKKPGIDHCAHQPRTLLHIDRSGCGTKPPLDSEYNSTQASQLKSASSSGGNACPPCPPQKYKDNEKPSSNEGITSRIMKTLNLGRSTAATGRSSGTTVAGPKCGTQGPSPGTGKARHAGDQSWCDSAKPMATQQRCRTASTLAERLGRRPPAPCTRRKLHMLATVAACGPEPKTSSKQDMASLTEKIKADNEKLNKVVQERVQLKDAAQGRVFACEKPKKCAPKPPVSGCFDVHVPPTQSPLRLRVFYDEICISAPASCPSKNSPKQAPGSKTPHQMKKSNSSPTTQTTTRPCNKTTTTSSTTTKTSAVGTYSKTNEVKSQKSDSWLSMKTLKQTIAGCVKTEGKSSDKKPPTAAKSPCDGKMGDAKKGDESKVIKPIKCPPQGPAPRCNPGVKPRCPPPPEPPKRDPCDSRPCCDSSKQELKSKDSKDNKKK